MHCVHGHPELIAEHGYPDEMDFALYRKIIDEASDYECPSLAVNNINEPLMARDIVERIRYAADHGFADIMMNTNALLMTERVSERLLDSGLTRLLVSMDAHSEETYGKIRLASNFTKVMANVERFLELRAKRNVKLPILRISMVRLAQNEHEVDAFVEFWRDRADYIAIQEFASPAPDLAKFDTMFADSR